MEEAGRETGDKKEKGPAGTPIMVEDDWEEASTLERAWAMFGEATIGSGGGSVKGIRSCFAMPRVNDASPDPEMEMGEAGVGCEEGEGDGEGEDEYFRAREQKIPTPTLSAGYAASLPTFSDVLRQRGLVFEDNSTPTAKTQKEGLHAFQAGATGDATTKSTITIKTPPKVYRRKQESQYMGPELGDDLLDGNWVAEELGKSLK